MALRFSRAARPLARLSCLNINRLPRAQIRLLSQGEPTNDPNQNGGYPDPPAIPRQFRDPHGDWWDKQERRNFGEVLHEDNDILGIFSPYRYTQVPPGKGALQLLLFISLVFGLYKAVEQVYPDRPAVPTEYEGGLDRELGGRTAVIAPEKGKSQ